MADLVDILAAIFIKAGICQWTVDKELVMLPAPLRNLRKTSDKDVVPLNDHQYDFPVTESELAMLDDMLDKARAERLKN